MFVPNTAAGQLRILTGFPLNQPTGAGQRAAASYLDRAVAVNGRSPSPSLILGSEFHTAVKGISEELGGAPLAGYETYGEIALAAGDMSGFHNTTTVVLAFPR
jgi:hypothetical protein